MLQSPPPVKWGGGGGHEQTFFDRDDFRVIIIHGNGDISPARRTIFKFEHTLSHPTPDPHKHQF